MESRSENMVEKLNATNYNTWNFSMKMFLIEKECWAAIEERQDTEDPESAMTEELKKKDQKALALIARCVEKSQFFLVRHQKTSLAAWKAIKEHYQTPTVSTRVKLSRKLRESKLPMGGSMPEHINAILECILQLQDIGVSTADKEAVIILLTSLNDDYDGIITTFNAWSEDRLTMANIRTSLIEEWERKTSQRKSAKERLGPKVVNMKLEDKSDFICNYCKEYGHIQRNCEKLKLKNKGTANLAAKSDWYTDDFPFEKGWIIDSGATSHMCSDRNLFSKFVKNENSTITIANGQKIECKGSGDVTLKIDLRNEILNVKLGNTLLIPDLHNNLLSVRALAEKGFEIIFKNDRVYLKKDGETMDIGEVRNHNYALRIKREEKAAFCVHEWHKRLAHKNLKDIKRMKETFKIKKCNCNNVCEACIKGKISRLPFPKEATPVQEALACVVSDICGPLQTQSIGKSRYFATFIDIFSGYCHVSFLKTKNEVIEKAKQFIEMLKTQTGRKPKTFRTDRALEYKSTLLQTYLQNEGIKFECTAGYSPEQNGVAERRNRTLMEAARSMLAGADLPNNLWAEAVSTANYVQNRTVSKRRNKTPFELLFGFPPRKQIYYEFGVEVYAMIPEERRKKLDVKAEKMRFIGYDEEAKAFKLLTKSNAIWTSREVKFLTKDSSKFSQEYYVIEDEEGDDTVDSISQDNLNDKRQNDKETQEEDEKEKIQSSQNVEIEDEEFEEESVDDLEVTQIEQEPSILDLSNYTDAQEEHSDSELDREPVLRRSTRSNFGKPPSRYGDYHLYKDNEIIEEEANIASSLRIKEPKTLAEAMRLPEAKQWMKAMQDELKIIEKNETWEEVEIKKNRRAIDCKWVYKVKYDEHGNVSKFKARLVAKGFTQKYGVDYDEVFAPVARQQTLRMLLSVAGVRNYNVKQYDVESAFLNGEISEEIYMKQPPGFKKNDKVLRLKKSLYGLKQAAKVWNEKLHETLINAGCIQNQADKCLYTAQSQEAVCYILTHVDDIIIADNNNNFADMIIEKLKRKFIIKELGNVNHYLGIDIKKDAEGNFEISQPNYIDKIVEEAKLQDARNSRTPINTGYYKIDKDGTEDQKKPLHTNEEFRKLIGMLLYLSTNTRPDISIGVSILSQRVSKPTVNDLSEVKRMIRYLKTTRNEKLKLSRKGENECLKAYTDADWAEETRDRKSHSGFLAQINGGTFAWSCRKQSLVALSSTEAEYIALCEATKEIIWLREVAKCFNVNTSEPTEIFVDNQSCMKIAENGKFSNRTKHIDTKYHFVRDQARKNIVTFKYIPTNENLADMLTKPLGPSKLKELRNNAGLNSNSMESNYKMSQHKNDQLRGCINKTEEKRFRVSDKDEL